MTKYQLHWIDTDGSLFGLPVYGTRETIWDALANHRHFRTFKTFCEVQKIKDKRKFKRNFKLVEVKP